MKQIGIIKETNWDYKRHKPYHKIIRRILGTNKLLYLLNTVNFIQFDIWSQKVKKIFFIIATMQKEKCGKM